MLKTHCQHCKKELPQVFVDVHCPICKLSLLDDAEFEQSIRSNWIPMIAKLCQKMKVKVWRAIRPRRPRFGIRAMLILIAIFGLLFAGFTNPYSKFKREQRIVREIYRAGGGAQFDIVPNQRTSTIGMIFGLKSLELSWHINFDETTCAQIGQLTQLESLTFPWRDSFLLTETELKSLSNLKSLKALHLANWRVSPDGIHYITAIKTLKYVSTIDDELRDALEVAGIPSG